MWFEIIHDGKKLLTDDPKRVAAWIQTLSDDEQEAIRRRLRRLRDLDELIGRLQIERDYLIMGWTQPDGKPNDRLPLSFWWS